MTALATASSEAPAIEDLTLEEALDNIAQIDAFLKANQPKIDEARAAQNELRTLIKLRMEEREAKKFERGGWRCFFGEVKQGSASLNMPDVLRTFLISTGEVPQSAIDDAFQIVVPPPVVKGDLRKVRKLADYGKNVASAIAAHVLEARKVEVLIIEPVEPTEINVTPAVGA